MWVAKNMLAEQAMVTKNLRFGIQPAARVIEVDLLVHVEAGVLGQAQLVERVGHGETGVGFEKGDEFRVLGHGEAPAGNLTTDTLRVQCEQE